MTERLSNSEKQRIRRLISDGFSDGEIAKQVRRDRVTIWRLRKGLGSTESLKAAAEQSDYTPAPKSYEELDAAAQRAHDDFEIFFRDFIGPTLPKWDGDVPTFWSEMATTISSGEHQQLLVNVAPGHGKTTCLLAYIVWRLARDRNTKVIYLSKSEKLAKRGLRWITWQLERNEKLIAAFGRFRPESGEEDVWSKTEIVIAGADVVTKEPSVSVYGARQGILGVRVELVIADDVADTSNSSTAAEREQLAEWFHTEVETRLEPQGVIAVVGSRLSPHDLYGELASHRDPTTEEPVYRRIRYPAHDATRCPGDGTHPGYPDGCTLWPERWPHATLMQRRLLQGPKFDLVYQQEDVAPGDTLVRREWIEGGTDPETGEELPGCLDDWRACGDVPTERGRLRSVVTVDPSPRNFWAIAWWTLAEDGTWYLIDLVRRRMGADELLDGSSGTHTGVLEDLADEAARVGYPLHAAIVEANAAQRWLLQTQTAREWSAARRVRLIPHTTGTNKADSTLGVWALAPRFRFGQVRIPHKDPASRERVAPLIEELCTYPSGQTDDCVMSSWFLLWNEAGLRPRKDETELKGFREAPGPPIPPPPRLLDTGKQWGLSR